MSHMSENDLQTAVIDLAQLLKLRVAHFRPARTTTGWVTPIQGDPGFPDLVIVGPYGLIFRELKSKIGRLSTDQNQWILDLKAAGQNVAIWRPEDLTNGTIMRQLRAIGRCT